MYSSTYDDVSTGTSLLRARRTSQEWRSAAPRHGRSLNTYSTIAKQARCHLGLCRRVADLALRGDPGSLGVRHVFKIPAEVTTSARGIHLPLRIRSMSSPKSTAANRLRPALLSAPSTATVAEPPRAAACTHLPGWWNSLATSFMVDPDGRPWRRFMENRLRSRPLSGSTTTCSKEVGLEAPVHRRTAPQRCMDLEPRRWTMPRQPHTMASLRRAAARLAEHRRRLQPFCSQPFTASTIFAVYDLHLSSRPTYLARRRSCMLLNRQPHT